MPRKGNAARLTAAAAMAVVALGSPLAGTASAATAAPAATQAASSVVPVNVTYYNTYFVGNVYWYDRSVTVKGTLRGQAASCRRVYVQAMDSANQVRDTQSTSTVCNAAIEETLQVSLNIVGGPPTVQVHLDDATPITLKFAICTRTKCTNYNG